MSLGLLRSALAAWLVLLAIMFANGVVRVTLLQPRLGEDPARRLASLAGVALVVGFSCAYVRRAGRLATPELLWVGAAWLVLTLCFEFGFGRASGRSWEELLADYDLARGRLWPLVLAATLLSPWAWGLLLRPSSR